MDNPSNDLIDKAKAKVAAQQLLICRLSENDPNLHAQKSVLIAMRTNLSALLTASALQQFDLETAIMTIHRQASPAGLIDRMRDELMAPVSVHFEKREAPKTTHKPKDDTHARQVDQRR